MTDLPPPLPTDDAALRDAMNRVRIEVGKAVIGQDGTVTGLLIALLARGHVLLEGVPGVAKTLLVRSFSAALGLDTKRIQFTPDLMPGDVSGSLIYDARAGEFEFREGPVFTNIVLADEINRTPPKTQAALLEAMEERQVSTDGVTRPLPDPFLVAATQNPIEHEGTYTLPEAQLDRFLMKVYVDYPDEHEDEPTVTCPYCRREIHEDAQRCPHCEQYICDLDAPTARKPWWIVVGVVVCLYVVFRWIVG